MAKGLVYLIENLFDGNYKIGYTEGNVEERRKQLLTGSSQELSVIFVFPTNYPQKLEKYLHRVFRHKHHRGEWFNLDAEHVSSFIPTCEQMEKSYNFLLENENYFIKKSENF